MLKHLKTALFFFCFSLAILFWGGYQNVNRILSMSRGNYFFENTKNSSALKLFRLRFPDNKTVTLEKKDNFWRIKEADDYFVDFAKINTFMKLIFQTIIYRADYIDSEKLPALMSDTLSIISVDEKGTILDTAIISPKSENNKFNYATLNNDNLLYQINGSFELSPFFADWIQSPLLAIPDNDIKFIHTDEFHAYRRYPSDELRLKDATQDVPQLRNLISSLWYLSAVDVKQAVHFKSNDYTSQRKYEITTFSGLIYELNLVYNANEYWLSINLREDVLISNQARVFFDENRVLYEDWYFLLPTDIGKTLANFSL